MLPFDFLQSLEILISVILFHANCPSPFGKPKNAVKALVRSRGKSQTFSTSSLFDTPLLPPYTCRRQFIRMLCCACLKKIIVIECKTLLISPRFKNWNPAPASRNDISVQQFRILLITIFGNRFANAESPVYPVVIIFVNTQFVNTRLKRLKNC